MRTQSEVNTIIDDVERILINSHYPAFNSKEIKGMMHHNPDNEFLVVNWGDYGRLLPEVSTLKFSDKYWNDDKYREVLI